MTYLPDEILCKVCTELWHQRDFNTLFNCARSWKQLAVIAMMNLYRVQGVAPNGDSDEDSDSGSDEDIPAHDTLGRIHHGHAKGLSQQQTITKCAGLWRTLILSSLGKTLFPYSQYIQKLNLRDLEKMLLDPNFAARNSEYFFEGELAPFQLDHSAAMSSWYQLNEVVTTSKIGEAITKQTPLLEELIGPVLSNALSQSIPHLPRLTHLKTWHRAIEDNGALIRLYCPSFKALHISQYYPYNHNSYLLNADVAAFLNELRPQSVESFKSLRLGNLTHEIFQALSCHGESLTELKLEKHDFDTFLKLSLLKRCTNLVSLSLAGNSEYTDVDDEELRRELFRETITWLKGCKKLRILTLIECVGPNWIAPILSENSIHLTSLKYQGFKFRDVEEFLQALAHQTSLQSLWLKGDSEWGAEQDDLVNSLSKLINLTDLRLEAISELLIDRHIVQLASSLSKLEVWSIRGDMLTDSIWGEVATLRSLRRLELWSLTRFTANGILDFIEKLGPGNQGLVLSVMHQDMRTNFSQVEKKLIREKIAKKVEGWFEFARIGYLDWPVGRETFKRML